MTGTVNVIVSRKVVTRGTPSNSTTEPGTKSAPLSVSVNPAPPKSATGMLSDVSVGAGFSTANGNAPDGPPPGPDVTTLTKKVCIVARSGIVTGTVNVIVSRKVVARGTPSNWTTELETKSTPLRVSVNAGPPSNAMGMLSDVSVGAGFSTASGNGNDVPPPGPGLTTCTEKVWIVARSPIVTGTVNVAESTNVLARGAPSNWTTEPETKSTPLRVSVNPAPPSNAMGMLSDVSVGAGFSTASGNGNDVPPPGPGLTTCTEKVWIVARSPIVTGTVNVNGSTKVVARAPPLNSTTELETKLLPLTVSVNAASPTLAMGGSSNASVGAGFSTASGKANDVPPGPGLTTCTEKVWIVARSPIVTGTVNVIVSRKVVARATMSNSTTEPATKSTPLSVSVNPAPPSNAMGMLNEVSVGTPKPNLATKMSGAPALGRVVSLVSPAPKVAEPAKSPVT